MVLQEATFKILKIKIPDKIKYLVYSYFLAKLFKFISERLLFIKVFKISLNKFDYKINTP